MFLRSWINILFLLAASWGSHKVISGQFYYSSQWQYYFCLVSPWVLLFGSINAWHRCFKWRRTSASKSITPDLSRGRHQQARIKERPGILEHACFALFLLSALAILKQLKIGNAGLWIGLILITFFM